MRVLTKHGALRWVRNRVRPVCDAGRTRVVAVYGAAEDLVFVPEGTGCVRADRAQIGQVVINLAINARDAMPDGGRLTIETHDVVLDHALAEDDPPSHAGPYVMLAVTDTGVGMDDSTRARIFEPFFTTKEHGQGTGLGLATVYGIVKQSGGSIRVYSERGTGTTFRVYLPRVDEAEHPADAMPAVTTAGGNETILVVEDDAAVRSLGKSVLEKAGYTVIAAANGAEALRLLEHAGHPVHLMITDVVMPDMNGWVLARQAAEIHPAMRVLYTSGYTENGVPLDIADRQAFPFISKPYTPLELACKVREVLDSSGP